MARNVLHLERKCPSCKKNHAAYRIVTKKVSRVGECHSCKVEFELSPVQTRLMWKYYRLSQLTANKVAESKGVDPAYCEDFAHELLVRFIRRYSFLSKVKLTTYLTTFIGMALSRWTQDDAQGGVSKRIRTNVKKNGDNAANGESNGIGPIYGKPDDYDPIRPIDAIDTLKKAKDRMSKREWKSLMRYAETGAGWGTVEMERLVIKAQRFIQGGNNGHTK